MPVTQVQSAADVSVLADHILDPGRDRVVVVVSTRGTDNQQMFDATVIDFECGDRAEVWTLPASRLGLQFSDRLPDMMSVYGGAARVYPKGTAWLQQPYQSPLYFAFDLAEADAKIDSLIDTAVELSYASAPVRDGRSDAAVAPVKPVVAVPLPRALGVRPSPSLFTAPVTAPPAKPVQLSPAVIAAASAPSPVPAQVAAPAAPTRPTPGPTHNVTVAAADKLLADPAPVPAAPKRGALQDALGALAMAKAELRMERMEHAQDRQEQAMEVAGLRKRLSDQQELHKERSASARKRKSAVDQAPCGSGWSPELFLAPEDAVRHAIVLAWAERVPAAEKAVYALPEYEVGPEFAASVDNLDVAQQIKAFKCVVDVLTDRARDIVSRRVHPLRAGSGGDNAPRTRSSDGAVCFRANIETGAASARRLHWWKTVDGSIELSRVVLHDDMDS